MTEPQTENKRTSSRRRLLGKIGLGMGLCIIVFVIIFGMLFSLVSADSGSTDMVHVYNILAGPSLIFGVLLVVAGLLAMLLPEGLSRDGLWSMQTGPYQR